MELHTESLRVVIDGFTGAISFFDKRGNTILSENSDLYDSFNEQSIDNEKCYSLKKYFNASEDEAFLWVRPTSNWFDELQGLPGRFNPI